MTTYQEARNTRRENRTLVGRIKSGLLQPAFIQVVRPSEGGMISASVTMELDPVAGRLITPPSMQMVSIFVPVQAMDFLANPAQEFAGLTEVIREKLLSPTPLFPLEAESDISKRFGVNPVSIGGVKKVSAVCRLAYNAAVNFLRLRAYDKATLRLADDLTIAPALFSSTALSRLNGVLNPDPHVNGAVKLALPAIKLPVKNLYGLNGGGAVGAARTDFKDSEGNTVPASAQWVGNSGNDLLAIGPDGSKIDVHVQLNETVVGNLSLGDFYDSQLQDKLTRRMAAMLKANPTHGPEMVERWAHGMSVDVGRDCFVVAEREVVFSNTVVGATDSAGVQNETMRTDGAVSASYVVPIPRTELGGVVVTLLALKPDEVMPDMPHPFLTEPWTVDNFVADELALDPVAVTMRDLSTDVPQANEATVAMYVGHNGLKQYISDYGFNRAVDATTVENKTSVWQVELPLSVSANNVNYPPLSQYPFANGAAEVATYVVTARAVIGTPLIFGPTPVEELPIIETAQLFEGVTE